MHAHLHCEGLLREGAREAGDVLRGCGSVGHAAHAHARLLDGQRRERVEGGDRREAAAAGAQGAVLAVLAPPAGQGVQALYSPIGPHETSESFSKAATRMTNAILALLANLEGTLSQGLVSDM